MLKKITVSIVCLFCLYAVIHPAYSLDKTYGNKVLEMMNVSLDDALELADKGLKNNSQDYYLYNIRGVIKEKLGNLYGAQTDYSHAIDLKPDYVAPIKNRGFVRNNLANYTGAIQDFNKAISIKADSDAYYGRGYSKLAMQNYTDAIEDFTNSIAYAPDDDMSYHQRGYSYCLLARTSTTPLYFNNAIQDFNKAIQLNPKNTEAYLYRGMAKAELKGKEAGIDDITYALDEYKRAGDNNAYYRSLEIYNWIMKEY